MPDLSPDGSLIVFYSTRNELGEIYTMRIDGRNQVRRLTQTPKEYSSGKPNWGSSGKMLFISNRTGQFSSYLANVEADGYLDSKDLLTGVSEPFDLSSDDKQITFTGGGGYRGNPSIYIYDLSKGVKRRIASGSNPRFNSDATRVVLSGAVLSIRSRPTKKSLSFISFWGF